GECAAAPSVALFFALARTRTRKRCGSLRFPVPVRGGGSARPDTAERAADAPGGTWMSASVVNGVRSGLISAPRVPHAHGGSCFRIVRILPLDATRAGSIMRAPDAAGPIEVL